MTWGIAQQELQVDFQLLDSQGRVIRELIDGQMVRVRLEPTPPLSTLSLSGPQGSLGTCEVKTDNQSCELTLNTLGWYWQTEALSPESPTVLGLYPFKIMANDQVIGGRIVSIKPRPVVLVHGYNSNAETWHNYLSEEGFLAPLGLSGFAVGDGQVPGIMNTGNYLRPKQKTLTIAENAAILKDYIAEVKVLTGAPQVDIVAHSMGGLISRYYIAKLMGDVDVAQLIMLGTPNGGSNCAQLPTSLGLMLPASLELRPDYVKGIFNPNITERHEIPFEMLAGVSINKSFQAPCTGIASDLVVDIASVNAIAGELEEMPILHTDLPKSRSAFENFVLPRLKRSADDLQDISSQRLSIASADTPQMTQLVSGMIMAGESREIIVNLDAVVVASFSLYDPSLSLAHEIRGASGNMIELSADKNGLLQFDDPGDMFQMGYGFENPKPGPWRVTLKATDKTPAEGAMFALSTQVVGGAALRVGSSHTLASTKDTVILNANLQAPQVLSDLRLQAFIYDQEHQHLATLDLSPKGQIWQALWQPQTAGSYMIDILAKARSEDLIIERSGFLSLEVYQAEGFRLKLWQILLLGLSLLIILLSLLGRRSSKAKLKV
ncbi:MAG: alpha/beta fold hydrolase [Deinococcales bacterium]